MRRLIQTTDNNQKGEPFDAALHLENLQRLSAKPLRELCLDEHPNLLIFPSDFETHGDDIGKQHIFALDGARLKTGNIMGFVGYRDTQVSIRSRFATDDRHDYFLHYMLRRVFAINLFDLKFNTDTESIFNFLIYLFPSFLRRALRQGIYKEYQTRRYNDANVRGRIDVSRHIRQNIPFAGQVAYTTREYATDNHLTQLVRHAIEYIACHPFSGNILNNDEETQDAVGKICQATPNYNRNARRQVISQNLRLVRHPYFNEYRNLQHLCLQILRHEEMKYGRDDDQIYGILFDSAWLWEEYLNTVLRDCGFEHPRNKTGEGRKHLFTDNTGWYYPDFYNKHIVLDAKYKGYANWSDVQSADLYQLITYMHVLNIPAGVFLVPVEWTGAHLPLKMLTGMGGKVFIEGMRILQAASSFREFVHNMLFEEAQLKEKLKEQISPLDVQR